jgi:hypothetical protein
MNTVDTVKFLENIIATVPVTNGITVADYARQPEASVTVGKLTIPELTGVLAQAQLLTGQFPEVLTNSGLGAFALSSSQLEYAGYVKIGTTDTYISGGQNSLVNVLKSPAVWTGKNGVNTLDSMLTNYVFQQDAQQTLMAYGINQLQQVGIPVDSLPARLQAGVALTSAIDPAATEAWIKGQAVPVNTQARFNQLVRDAAYAVDFTETKVNNALKKQVDALGYTTTFDRTEVDAAVASIIGNDKIPVPVYGAEPVDQLLLTEFNTLYTQTTVLKNNINKVISQPNTVQTAEVRQIQLQSYRTTLAALSVKFSELKIRVENSVPYSPDLVAKIDSAIAEIAKELDTIDQSIQLIQRIKTQLQGR